MEFFGIDLISLIKSIGYLGITGIVFAESGLLVGFFLPGDSLLFTAGFLASQDFLDITMLIVLTFIAAVTGDSVGYWFGKKVGPAIFKREEGFFFRKDHITRTQEFYAKYGPKAIVLARFMPIVRTFAPILAGVGKMHYPTFLTYNILGGLFWTAGLSLLGFYFGSIIPDPDKYLLPIILIIIVLSILPGAIEILKVKMKKEKRQGKTKKEV